MGSTTPEQLVLTYIRKVVEGESGSKPLSTIPPLSLLPFPACTILTEAPSLTPLCWTVTCEPHKLFLHPAVFFLVSVLS